MRNGKQKNDVFKKTSNFKKNALPQSKLFTKPPQFTSDFEKRKLAEQRATKRLWLRRKRGK